MPGILRIIVSEAALQMCMSCCHYPNNAWVVLLPTGLLDFTKQWKLTRGQIRNSGKILLGQGGSRANIRVPCLLSPQACSLYGVRVGIWPGVRPEGWHRCLPKAMATYSSTLAWQIPWMEEPGRLQFMGSLGVGHYWATSLSLFTFMHWRRKWQPTPVFLPGESQGQGSLVGCRLWGRTESDTTAMT